MNEDIEVESDPRSHAMKIRERMNELINHLREGVDKIEEPQARALFETSAEVVSGLARAFEHYETKSEGAWNSHG